MSSETPQPPFPGESDPVPSEASPPTDGSSQRPLPPPGQFIPPPASAWSTSPPSTHVRRKIDVSATASLALGAPAFLYSAGIVILVAFLLQGLGQTALAISAILLWLLPGPLLFVRPIEGLYCKLVVGLRQPTPSELERISSLWAGVTAAAGVDGSKYTIWVEESDNTNAYAVGGRAVAVTRWALETLPPQQLAAGLAHELGHHLGGHSWTQALLYWYSAPGRIASRLAMGIIGGIWRTSTNMALSDKDEKANTGCAGLAIIIALVLFVCMVAYSIIRMNPWLLSFFALFLSIPFFLAYLRRRSELSADLLATHLGYGPALIEVYRSWQDEGDDRARRQQSKRRQLLETHPSCAQRIATIEKQIDLK